MSSKDTYKRYILHKQIVAGTLITVVRISNKHFNVHCDEQVWYGLTRSSTAIRVGKCVIDAAMRADRIVPHGSLRS